MLLAADTRAECRLAYRGWRVAAAASLGVFAAALAIVTLPVFLKELADEFGWSRQEISIAFAIAAGTAALVAPWLGRLLDRVSVRRVAPTCACVFGLAFASLHWLQPHLGHLYAVFAVLGISGIGTSPVAYGRAIATWFTSRRGLAFALVVAGGAVGGIVQPPLVGAVSAALGWRTACLLLGACVVLVVVPTIATVVDERGPPPDDATHAAARIGPALRNRVYWLVLASMFGGTMLQNSVILHLPAMLGDRGAAPGPAAAAMSIMAATAVLGRLLTGLAIDRWSAAPIGAVALLLAAGGASLLATSSDVASAIVGCGLVGFGTGGEADVVPYLLARHFGPSRLSRLYGLAWLAGGIGGGLGPVLMGRGFDRTGSYAGVLVALAVVAVVAAALLLLLPRTRSQPR